jgi:hypothetical protein
MNFSVTSRFCSGLVLAVFDFDEYILHRPRDDFRHCASTDIANVHALADHVHDLTPPK